MRTTETEVMVVSAHKKLSEERMKLCGELWKADIKVVATLPTLTVSIAVARSRL